MTLEERRAYADAQRNKRVITQKRVIKKEKKGFDWKILIALMLSVVFLSLDYPGHTIRGIGSEEIVREVTTDSEIFLEYFENL